MTNGGYTRPSLPRDVSRTLRQEAGFGCAECGHPYIEYHHIVPWSEDQHFRPEDMIALCPNHHASVEKLGRDLQNQLKANAYNKKKGVVAGALEYDKRDLAFKVGGMIYENVPTIIQYKSKPLVACRLEDGQALVCVCLFDRSGNSVLEIIDNEVAFRVDALWDFEYGHNWAIARSGPRDVALKLDFRGSEATIEGKLWVGGKELLLRPDHTNLPGNNIFRGRIVGCAVGIQIGDENAA